MRRMNIFDKKGQNTAEYAILIALVIAAAVAMQTYVKRGMQGRVHDASDSFYDKVTTGAATDWNKISTTTAGTLANKQYEPTELSSQSTQETVVGEGKNYEKTGMAAGGTVTRESVQTTKQANTDYQKYDY